MSGSLIATLGKDQVISLRLLGMDMPTSGPGWVTGSGRATLPPSCVHIGPSKKHEHSFVALGLNQDRSGPRTANLARSLTIFPQTLKTLTRMRAGPEWEIGSALVELQPATTAIGLSRRRAPSCE